MAVTGDLTLRDLILLALGRLGGAARARDVLVEIELLWAGNFTPEDRELIRSGLPKWRNNVGWARKHLIADGLLVNRSDGTWELAGPGRARLATLRATPPPVVPTGATPVDPLKRFTPKDSSDYLAHLAGRLLVKSRAHEKLVEDYGLWAAGRGFRPFTPHPRDLVLEHAGGEWLVEAKVIYDENATEAVRAAVGQLFTYRYFLYIVPKKPVPSLLGLFSAPIGGAYVDFLDSLSITSVWRSAGSWAGSLGAVTAGLAP